MSNQDSEACLESFLQESMIMNFQKKQQCWTEKPKNQKNKKRDSGLPVIGKKNRGKRVISNVKRAALMDVSDGFENRVISRSKSWASAEPGTNVTDLDAEIDCRPRVGWGFENLNLIDMQDNVYRVKRDTVKTSKKNIQLKSRIQRLENNIKKKEKMVQTLLAMAVEERDLPHCEKMHLLRQTHSEVVTLKKENERLTRFAEESGERIMDLEAQASKARVSELQKLAVDCKAELEDLREVLQEKKSRNALLESTNRTLQANMKRLRKEIYALKKSLAQERKRSKKKDHTLEEKQRILQESRVKIAMAERKYEDSLQTISNLKRRSYRHEDVYLGSDKVHRHMHNLKRQGIQFLDILNIIKQKSENEKIQTLCGNIEEWFRLCRSSIETDDVALHVVEYMKELCSGLSKALDAIPPQTQAIRKTIAEKNGDTPFVYEIGLSDFGEIQDSRTDGASDSLTLGYSGDISSSSRDVESAKSSNDKELHVHRDERTELKADPTDSAIAEQIDDSDSKICEKESALSDQCQHGEDVHAITWGLAFQKMSDDELAEAEASIKSVIAAKAGVPVSAVSFKSIEIRGEASYIEVEINAESTQSADAIASQIGQLSTETIGTSLLEQYAADGVSGPAIDSAARPTVRPCKTPTKVPHVTCWELSFQEADAAQVQEAERSIATAIAAKAGVSASEVVVKSINARDGHCVMAVEIVSESTTSVASLSFNLAKTSQEEISDSLSQQYKADGVSGPVLGSIAPPIVRRREPTTDVSHVTMLELTLQDGDQAEISEAEESIKAVIAEKADVPLSAIALQVVGSQILVEISEKCSESSTTISTEEFFSTTLANQCIQDGVSTPKLESISQPTQKTNADSSLALQENTETQANKDSRVTMLELSFQDEDKSDLSEAEKSIKAVIAEKAGVPISAIAFKVIGSQIQAQISEDCAKSLKDMSIEELSSSLEKQFSKDGISSPKLESLSQPIIKSQSVNDYRSQSQEMCEKKVYDQVCEESAMLKTVAKAEYHEDVNKAASIPSDKGAVISGTETFAMTSEELQSKKSEAQEPEQNCSEENHDFQQGGSHVITWGLKFQQMNQDQFAESGVSMKSVIAAKARVPVSAVVLKSEIRGETSFVEVEIRADSLDFADTVASNISSLSTETMETSLQEQYAADGISGPSMESISEPIVKPRESSAEVVCESDSVVIVAAPMQHTDETEAAAVLLVENLVVSGSETFVMTSSEVQQCISEEISKQQNQTESFEKNAEADQCAEASRADAAVSERQSNEAKSAGGAATNVLLIQSFLRARIFQKDELNADSLPKLGVVAASQSTGDVKAEMELGNDTIDSSLQSTSEASAMMANITSSEAAHVSDVEPSNLSSVQDSESAPLNNPQQSKVKDTLDSRDEASEASLAVDNLHSSDLVTSDLQSSNTEDTDSGKFSNKSRRQLSRIQSKDFLEPFDDYSGNDEESDQTNTCSSPTSNISFNNQSKKKAINPRFSLVNLSRELTNGSLDVDSSSKPSEQWKEKPSVVYEKTSKLSASTIQNFWGQKRGPNARGPKKRAIRRVMRKSRIAFSPNDNIDKVDKLTKQESQSISRAFIKKSGAENLDIDTTFYYLDANDDEFLDEEEVAYAIQAMWLMSGDNVPLQELLEKQKMLE